VRKVKPQGERLGRRQAGERWGQGRDERAGVAGEVGVVDEVAVALGVGANLLGPQLGDVGRLGDPGDQGPVRDRAGVQRPQLLRANVKADTVDDQRLPPAAQVRRQRRGAADRDQLD
jgi:hypothetical protein